MKDYINSYQAFFKKPTKNLDQYKDILELMNYFVKKENSVNLFKAECIVQQCDNLENFHNELSLLQQLLQKNKVNFV